jgi:hypothetical protein
MAAVEAAPVGDAAVPAEMAEAVEAEELEAPVGVAETVAAAEPAETAPPAPAEALVPQGGEMGADAEAAVGLPEADSSEGPAEAEKRSSAIAAPVAEMLDAEAESPILPASDEREES